jgi:hydrogenase expression/formation protein HypC
MCLAVPGKVMEIHGKCGIVDFGGARREVQLDLLKKVRKGDYVLVHVGYAIQTVDEKSAEEMLKSWSEVARGEIHA